MLTPRLVGIEIGREGKYQRLAFRIHFGAMQRMAGYDLYIDRQVLFESCKFRGLAGGLATHDGANLGSFEFEFPVRTYGL